MSVTNVDKDFDRLTLTVIADFDAPLERVWQLWADPRKLERWWGPPTYPATVEQHDLTPGGDVTYFMTGPEGEQYGGWWRVTSVEPAEVAGVPRRLRRPGRDADPDMPTTTVQCSSPSTTAARGWNCARSSTRAKQMEQLDAWAWPRACGRPVGQMDALLAG